MIQHMTRRNADIKCKFYYRCSFADPDSATCTQDNGGKYCGKYRLYVCAAYNS